MASSATLNVTINSFSPAGSGDTGATITLGSYAPTTSAWISVANNNVTINSAQSGGVDLTFSLSTADYVLIGISFSQGSGQAGRSEFPNVTLTRSSSGSTLTVHDNDTEESNNDYTYVLVVEQTSDGALGFIDPRISNDF